MGNESSKKKEQTIISLEQKKCILNFLGSQKPTNVHQENLQLLWSDKMSDGLRKTFLCYLFRNTKVIPFAEFELFFYNMTQGGLEDQAKTLVGLVGSDDYVLRKDLHMYVSDIMNSYMVILKSNFSAAYASWSSGDSMQNDDVEAISCFVMKDIKHSDDGKIDIDELEKWLNRTSLLKEINQSVMKIAFGITNKGLQPVLPKANKETGLLSVPMVLALSHFSRCPMKNWRLLYSSAIEPHSWQIFTNKLFKEGPTIVIIRDKDKNTFGGYASQSWKLTPSFYGDENCFLFRLRPDFNLCLPTRYNENYQYINSGAATLPNGLGMGGQLSYFGFFLSSEFGPASVSKSCTTFRDYVQLAPEEKFDFSQLEVWAVGERDVEEEGVRQVGAAGGGLIMQRDVEAMTFMEMAGKTSHAKAAGEDIES